MQIHSSPISPGLNKQKKNLAIERKNTIETYSETFIFPTGYEVTNVQELNSSFRNLKTFTYRTITTFRTGPICS